MTSRKKGKRSSSFKAKITSEDVDRNPKFNPHIFFSAEEIYQIKTVLRIKDVINIPIVIGCVILNKLELMKKVIKQGVDINEIGPNNTTALIWAVRYKYMDLIHFLLNCRADVTIKTDNSENVIIVALEHKLWDEDTFVEFLNMVKKTSSIDMNSTNKNGHSLLHIAVRREWEKFINILLKEKIVLDTPNVNGVTPLMTACYRNNSNIVNTLIQNEADLKKEDAHCRTALCYAILTGSKFSKQSHEMADIIIKEMDKTSQFKEYVKRRIQILNATLSKEKTSEATLEMIITIIQYIVQYTIDGAKLLLECKIFDQLQKALTKTVIDDKRKYLLLIALETMFYNEQVHGFSTDLQLKLAQQFLLSNMAITCTEIVKAQEAYYNFAFYILLIFCMLNEVGHKWLQENYDYVKGDFRKLLGDCTSNLQKDFTDAKRLKLIKKKLKKLKRTLNAMEEDPDTPIDDEKHSDDHEDKEKNIDESSFNSSKKSKRRARSIKAKPKNPELEDSHDLNVEKPNEELNGGMDKISCENVVEEGDSVRNYVNEQGDHAKTGVEEVDIGEKNIIGEKLLCEEEESIFPIFDPQTLKEISENEQIIHSVINDDLFYACENDDSQNLITSSLKEFLKTNNEMENKEDNHYVPLDPEWKLKICGLPFNDWPRFSENLKVDREKLGKAIQCLRRKISGKDIGSCLNLQIIVGYLKELLDIVIARYKESREFERKENEILAVSELQENFRELVSTICSLVNQNPETALKEIFHLESVLLNFPIRGKTLLTDICASESVKIQYTTSSFQEETSLYRHMENVLNGFEKVKEDTKITVVYDDVNTIQYDLPEVFGTETELLSPRKPRDKKKELEDKMKTMENAYHLVGSIEKLIDERDDDFTDLPFSLELPKISGSESKYSDMVLKILTDHVAKEVDTIGIQKGRWADKVLQLKSTKQSQQLLGGDIRLCKYPERSHIISQGGNFNLVTLGLSANDQPLAIKRVPREHCVCKVLKALINPLLGLRNKNLLHYFVCDYEENDLILATPLCEYNIGQYVLLLKENSDKKPFSLTQLDIVSQFLNGLAFLHQRLEPIVHGNLKPSNIFVDINGIVRLAEFGINKALFKLIEAPESSLIWFSQETYRRYKISSLIECALSSDIQVAGMLIYFIVSGGVHPLGTDVTHILKNLEKLTFTLPSNRDAKNQVFTDLISWMLMYEPNDRPTIKQVLSHVMFWSNDRRWRFILNCAGISTNGVPLNINVTELHKAIDVMSAQEQIKGHWVNIARRKFPRIKFNGEDTVVGLLKFIRQFYEDQILTEENVSDLRNCILTYFPAFPLTLYRILEATGIIKEFPFKSYTIAENLIV